MSTHNRYIYHCLKCGSIVIREPGEPTPLCCGNSMNQSAAETVEDAPMKPPHAPHESPSEDSDEDSDDDNMPLLDGDPPEAVDLAVWFD
ncbi:MAG TPA: hypothetical protein DDY91_01140 [Planctomycetaceae bacterium]|jgi:hypothetical protein|nr:hypothetical protein [Planctomycetaceae bacterium]